MCVIYESLGTIIISNFFYGQKSVFGLIPVTDQEVETLSLINSKYGSLCSIQSRSSTK